MTDNNQRWDCKRFSPERLHNYKSPDLTTTPCKSTNSTEISVSEVSGFKDWSKERRAVDLATCCFLKNDPDCSVCAPEFQIANRAGCISRHMTESIESSLAFLQIQKSQSNLKRVRAGARNDDVFRIFRRTGQRIALIAQQIERERCTYLKNSYTEKNQLCKEFSAILRSNRIDSGARSLASANSSECRSDKENERREKRKKAAIRRINVNVFKRCECCRRLALRAEEYTDGGGRHGEGDAHECTEHDAENDKNETAVSKEETVEDKEKLEARNQKPVASPTNANAVKSKQGPAAESPRVQFCCPPSQDIQSNTGSPTIVLPKKPEAENGRHELRRLTASSLGTISLGCPSAAPTGSTGSPRRGQGARSTSLRRGHSAWLKQSVSPAPLEPLAKVKLAGNAWHEHVRSLQSRASAREGTPDVTLPEAYEAFRKLVRAMEATDRLKEREYLREIDLDGESEWSGGRARIGESPAHSARWQPLKRSSVCHSDAASFCELNFLRVGSPADRALHNWHEESGETAPSADRRRDRSRSICAPDGIFLTESC